MIQIHPFDYTLLGVYVLFLIWAGWRYRQESGKSEVNYLLDGRKITLPAFVATLVTTWYGGILGVGEYSFKYGISNWLVFGVPYYLTAAIFAVFITKAARRSMLLSIPDQLEKAYGRSASLTGAAIVFVMTVPAAYVLMLGELLKMFFGGSLLIWIILGTLFSTGYVAMGGFRSVVRTDVVQFVLMYLGFLILLIFAVMNFGGFHFLKTNLPSTHLTWHGGRSFSGVFVWYFIALATLIEPAFYQRTYAAKSASTARNGIFLSILFWIFFDFLSTSVGLYARAALPADTDPILGYPIFADSLLPTGFKGLFLLALLSVIMSTVDSYSFLAAQTLGRDLLARANKTIDNWRVNRIQLGLFASAILAVIIAAWRESVVGIWHDLGSIGTSMLLLPIAGSFRSPSLFPRRWILPSMIISGGITLFWTLAERAGIGYPLGIEPIYIGLGCSVLILGGGALIEFSHCRNR